MPLSTTHLYNIRSYLYCGSTSSTGGTGGTNWLTPTSLCLTVLLADVIVGGASQISRPMSCKAVGFADLRSRRRFMSLDRARANARHHCRRSATYDRMRLHQRRYDERVSSVRSMPDRGKDAAVTRSQMRTSTTITSVPVSTRACQRIEVVINVQSWWCERRWYLLRLSIVTPTEIIRDHFSRVALLRKSESLAEIIFCCSR